MCTSQPVSPIVHYRDSNIPTIADIRNKWCFGLPLCNTSGNVITDEAIEHFIYAAIKNVERKLGVFLKPTIIVTNPLERGLVEGFDYEVAEPAYDYDAKAYANWGFLQLRERHVQSLQSLKLVLPNGQIIVDFLTRPEWVKLYPKEAQIQIVPYAGDPTVFYY
jgi:hypothetical protein